MKYLHRTNQLHPQNVARRSSIQRHSEDGQAIIEFALVLPILIIMLLGVVFFAMAFNLQMVLNTAAREGARVWASNRGDTSPCGSVVAAICDPDLGDNGFKRNVYPIVRKYLSDNGYDGNNVIFEEVQIHQRDVPAAEWKAIPDSAEDATKVKLVISYPIRLPTSGFQLEIIHLYAQATFKRGA